MAGRGRGAGALPVLDLALAAALVLLAVGVGLGWQPVGLDRAVERALPAPGSARLLMGVAEVVTVVATPALVVPATLAVGAAVAAATRATSPLRFTALRVAALTITVLAGKALLHRPGPTEPHVSALHGYFPSGHTATALVCTGTLAALLVRHRPRWRTCAYTVVGVWTALVAAGLVVHRYHWLSDVVAAALLGALVLRRVPLRP